MIKEALILLPLISGWALAASPDDGARPSLMPTSPAVPHDSLDALRHHQPDAATVREREIEEYGPAWARREKEQQKAIDDLYQELMRRSAPYAAR